MNLKCINSEGINNEIAIISISHLRSVKGAVQPTVWANYREVPLSNINPESVSPILWKIAWYKLILLLFFIYLRHNPSRAISCIHIMRLNPTVNQANMSDWDWSVKKDPIIRRTDVLSWLMRTHVFLLPYETLKYF